MDGKKVIERTPWFAGTEAGKVTLEANKRVPIKMEYLNKDGAAMAVLDWKSASQKRQTVPQSQLYPATEPLPRLSIAASTGKIAENATTPIVFTVTRSGETKKPLTVPLKVDGSAKERYVATFESVTIPAGQASATVSAKVVDDKVGQPEQGFAVTIPQDENWVTAKNFRAEVKIQDDEIPAPGDGKGLKGEYFAKTDFTDLKKTRVDGKIEFGWGDDAPMKEMPRDDFSVRWSGQVLPHFSETYTFYLDGDDSARLLIDGKVVVDWTAPGSGTKSAEVALQKGKRYPLVVELKEGRFGSGARLAWQSATQYRQIVPASQLFPAP